MTFDKKHWSAYRRMLIDTRDKMLDKKQSQPELSLEERAALLESEVAKLGEMALQNLLEECGLEEGLSTLEAGAIAGCIAHMDAVGSAPNSSQHSEDEIMRTRINLTLQRKNATERDKKLYKFKSELRELAINNRLFGRKPQAEPPHKF